MKLDQFGKEYKKHGYLEGTAMWRWKILTVGGVLLLSIAIDTISILYARQRKEPFELPIDKRRRLMEEALKLKTESLEDRKNYLTKLLSDKQDEYKKV